MNRMDIPTMATQLNMLAETFDKKPITEKAALVWFDTLKDFPTERICGVLIGWPKTHHKFPVPAEVFKICNEAASVEIEAKAAREKREVFSPSADPAYVRSMMGEMRKILSRPRRSPREHWRHLLANAPPGSLAHRYANDVLSPVRESDDEIAA